MSWIEWVAAIAGAVAVYLGARENVWSWPIAILNVSLSAVLFFESGLYSDMGLQVVYLVLSIYGWNQWLHGGANHSTLRVSRATSKQWMVSAAVGVAAWFILWRVTSLLPGVSLPFVDSGLTAISLVAQWMLTRKILENWILWIVADVVYVPMYVHKSLPVMAGLYALFLVLAVIGFVRWRRSLYASKAET